MKTIALVLVFLLICSISYINSEAISQINQVRLTINPGASDSNSQNPIEPANITIPVGSTIIWLNNDSIYHQIISGTPDEGPTNIFYGDFFGPNESYNVTFDTVGEFDYYDPIWTNIKGQIITVSENNTDLAVGIPNNQSVEFTDDQTLSQTNVNTGLITSNNSFPQQQRGIVGENTIAQPQSQPQPQPSNQIQPQPEQSVQDQSFQPIQEQLQIPQHGDINSFKATGTINSYIVTPTSPWNTTGEWTLIVEDGEMKNFITNMAWFNGTSGHTHDFLNFDSSGDIELPADNIITIDGEMDVASNGIVTWDEVESSINIGGGGRTITINVDHDETDHHFAGQPVVGTVTSLTPCSDSPGPNMEILPTCD